MTSGEGTSLTRVTMANVRHELMYFHSSEEKPLKMFRRRQKTEVKAISRFVESARDPD
jgi:hypothetical protein